jgi:hypothetical protein
VRQWTIRESTWLPQTVANVVLTFHFIPLVQLSGSIEAFSSVLGPLLTIQILQQKLKYYRQESGKSQKRSIRFELTLNPDEIWDQTKSMRKNSLSVNTSPIQLPNNWSQRGAYLGLNVTWRPFKHIKESSDKNDREPWRPFVLSLGFVTPSCGSALYLSFSKVTRSGFECRSLS